MSGLPQPQQGLASFGIVIRRLFHRQKQLRLWIMQARSLPHSDEMRLGSPSFNRPLHPRDERLHGLLVETKRSNKLTKEQPLASFMVASVEHILKEQFGKSLSDKEVHILDPFGGTGHLIVNIMRQIPKSALPYKYTQELHCNEVMLLAIM
jgi:hypothetical protein